MCPACGENGKQLKSVPAKLKKDEYIVVITEAKKQMAEQARRTRAMLEGCERVRRHTRMRRFRVCWKIL